MGNNVFFFLKATANTRLVGLELAYLLRKLRDDHGLHPEDVHLIGHSLGSHLASYAGERIPNIGRITGRILLFQTCFFENLNFTIQPILPILQYLKFDFFSLSFGSSRTLFSRHGTRG
jgi:pimeloyl-ACP methyl ester carboxylesterase